MKTLELSVEERIQFQYLLPIQGSIATLDTVMDILNKIQVKEVTESDNINVDFEDHEIELMKVSVKALDSSQKLHIQSLELAKKILRS
jgi:hypothetical protein